MNCSSRILKAHLWQAYAAATGAVPPVTLRDYLQGQAGTMTALLAAGEIKANTTNGQTTEFRDSGVTSELIVQIWVYLAELFDIATLELQQGTPPIATPSDAQVKTQMELNLRPIFGATDNYMWLIK